MRNEGREMLDGLLFIHSSLHTGHSLGISENMPYKG